MRMHGRARDIITLEARAVPLVVADDYLDILASIRREILEISTIRGNREAQHLIGRRAGGGLREVMGDLFVTERQRATPLYLLLDDYPGASLVANWAWSQWMDNSLEACRRAAGIGVDRAEGMTGVCTGLRPGSDALGPDGFPIQAVQSCAPVPPLENSGDPEGWHPLPIQRGVGMRRARWMDLWLADGGDFELDLGFQDSATSPAGGRIGLHEYRVHARADAKTFALLAVDVTPHVLPYPLCPEATQSTNRLLGASLGDMRTIVTDRLPGVLGCTHLNDMFRSMADVPAMAALLRTQGSIFGA